MLEVGKKYRNVNVRNGIYVCKFVDDEMALFKATVDGWTGSVSADKKWFDKYVEIEPEFEVGKTYQFPSSIGFKYKILFIEPDSGDAFAHVEVDRGYPYRTTLAKKYRKEMIEIK